MQEVIEEKEDDLEKVLDSQLQKAHAHEQYWLEKVESLEKSRKEASVSIELATLRFLHSSRFFCNNFISDSKMLKW